MHDQANALLVSLREFIAQPDYPTLVLNGNDASMIFPNRALAAFDREDDGDFYLLFPQPFTDAGDYMGIIAESLTQQLEILNAEIAARQVAPVPGLPAFGGGRPLCPGAALAGGGGALGAASVGKRAHRMGPVARRDLRLGRLPCARGATLGAPGG